MEEGIGVQLVQRVGRLRVLFWTQICLGLGLGQLAVWRKREKRFWAQVSGFMKSPWVEWARLWAL